MYAVPMWSARHDGPSSSHRRLAAKSSLKTQPAPSKLQLIDMLNALVQQLLNASACSSSCDTTTFTRDDEDARELCRVLDRLMLLDLTDVSAGYWPAVRLFLSKSQIDQLMDRWEPKSERAKSLCWLYQSLNDASLEFQVRCFAEHPDSLRKFYGNKSLLTDRKNLLSVADFLQYLEGTHFSITLPNPARAVAVSRPPNSSNTPKVSLSKSQTSRSSSSVLGLERSRSGPNAVPVATVSEDARNLEASVADSTRGRHDPFLRLLTDSVAVADTEPCDDALNYEAAHSRVSKANPQPTTSSVIVKRSAKTRASGRRRTISQRSGSLTDIQPTATTPVLSGPIIRDLPSSSNLMDRFFDSPAQNEFRTSTPKLDDEQRSYTVDEATLFRQVLASKAVKNVVAVDCGVSPPSSQRRNSSPQPTQPRKSADRAARNWIMDPQLWERARMEDERAVAEQSIDQSSPQSYADQLLSRLPMAKRTADDFVSSQTVEETVLSVQEAANDESLAPVSCDLASSNFASTAADHEIVVNGADDEDAGWQTAVLQQRHQEGEIRLEGGEIVELSLQLFDDDNEQFYKMFRVYQEFAAGTALSRWLVLTTRALYVVTRIRCTDDNGANNNLLSNGGRSSAKYSAVVTVPLLDLDCAIVSLNYQSFSLVRQSNREYVHIDTAAELHSRTILSSLDVAVRRSSGSLCVIEQPAAQIDLLLKWIRAELAIAQTTDISIDLYTLVYWRVTDGRPDASVSSEDGDRLCRSGYLYVRDCWPSAWFTTHGDWTNRWCMLRCRKLYEFTDSTCREGVRVLDLRSQVSGARLSSSSDRPFCVDVLLAEDDTRHLQFACQTRQQAAEWLDTLLTSLSLADDTMTSDYASVSCCCLVLCSDHLLLGQENRAHSFVRTLAVLPLAKLNCLTALRTTNKYAVVMQTRNNIFVSDTTETWWMCVRNRHEFDKFVSQLSNQELGIDYVSSEELMEESLRSDLADSSQRGRAQLLAEFERMTDYWRASAKQTDN